jgi:hypothetical protein
VAIVKCVGCVCVRERAEREEGEEERRIREVKKKVNW